MKKRRDLVKRKGKRWEGSMKRESFIPQSVNLRSAPASCYVMRGGSVNKWYF